VLDDLLKAKDAYSEAFRNMANSLYDETLRSRLNQPSKDFFIGISQRLHGKDIVGFLRALEPERWFFIDIPLECEEDTDYVFPISGKVHHRKKGEVLLPKRFTPAVIAGFKKNPRVWAGQYQQRPSPAGGYIFFPDKWSFYDPATPPDPPFQIMSVDCSFKALKDSDLVAIHVYGVAGPDRWLLGRDTQRRDFPNTLAGIRDMRASFPKVSWVLIEDKGQRSSRDKRSPDGDGGSHCDHARRWQGIPSAHGSSRSSFRPRYSARSEKASLGAAVHRQFRGLQR
jgi:hypothetical protein